MMRHDVVIIGGGLAGLRCALELGKSDALILCKTYPNEAHSAQAQGGINAAINPKDNWKDHAYDTIKGGDYLNDQLSVEYLCREAPGIIKEMAEWGTNFTRTADGSMAQRAFGGQRFKRTCFAADRTGHALVHALYKKALENGARIMNETIALAVSTNGKEISGVIAMDLSTMELFEIAAKAVVIATGGAGRIYSKTTNPENTGDGMAIAYRAGAAIMDMEMMQFHPTTLRGSNKLLSEAARGEGAYLINAKKERFMKRYAPEKMELAPRDVTTRAIMQEIRAGRGVMGDSVYLDFRHLEQDFIMSRIPGIHKNALELAGVDIFTQPVAVQPAQHYTMAGIACDIDGKSEVIGLFACGEAACLSVHGANRLGGNSLMETLVFGKRTGKAVAAYVKGKPFYAMDKKFILEQEKKIKFWLGNRSKGNSNDNGKSNGVSPRDASMALGKTMDDCAGPFRDAKGLEKAKTEISKIRKDVEKNILVRESGTSFNGELLDAIQAEFMADLAGAIVVSAIDRKESRGAHFREDFPGRNDGAWLKHIKCYYNGKESAPGIAYRKVEMTKWKPEERKY